MKGHSWGGPGWAAFAPGVFGRRVRRFKRGLLKYVVLKLLADEPRHGYDLIRVFRRKGWGGGPGSIYPLLASLEEEGLVAGHDEGDRRTYQITETGRSFLQERAGHVEAFFEDDGEDDDEEAGGHRELRAAAGRLMQAIAQLGADSKAETIERVRDLLDRTRREIYTLLAQE